MAKTARFFKNVKDEEILRNKVKRAKKEIRAATEELRKLMSHSRKGTLHKRRLESGLKKLSRHVGLLEHDPHWPHHHGP